MRDESWNQLQHTKITNQQSIVMRKSSLNFMQDGVCWEVGALKRLSGLQNYSPYTLQMLDKFIHPGKVSSGQHACIVSDVLGGNVGELQIACKDPLPLPLTKHILLHTNRLALGSQVYTRVSVCILISLLILLDLSIQAPCL